MDRGAEKRKLLKDGLRSSGPPVVAVGAHDAMSAKLIGQFGFDACWVSGLGVSTMTYALPDMNLISMAETLAASVRIDLATDLPVLADCDNGFGGFLNVLRTVREFERAGIAGICVEDNTFPKRNSLYEGRTVRELIDVDEQARRIRSAKAEQATEDFVFVARVEALIAGHGVEEACHRADAYVEAGADAILIHSRDRTLSDIEAFLERWNGTGTVPLVSVPTLYPDFTVDQLAGKGFRMVIFANQPMRAAVGAMERTLEALRAHRKAAAVDPEIVPVDRIFGLVNTKEAIALEEGARGS